MAKIPDFYFTYSSNYTIQHLEKNIKAADISLRSENWII
jgi:hypothetical protein